LHEVPFVAMGALLLIGGIAAVAGSVTYGVLFTLAGRRRPWWMAYVVTLVVWTVIGCLSLVIFNRTGVCPIVSDVDGAPLSDAEMQARCNRPNIAVIATVAIGYLVILVVALQDRWWNRSENPAAET
jgi:hypothetical protein